MHLNYWGISWPLTSQQHPLVFHVASFKSAIMIVCLPNTANSSIPWCFCPSYVRMAPSPGVASLPLPSKQTTCNGWLQGFDARHLSRWRRNFKQISHSIRSKYSIPMHCTLCMHLWNLERRKDDSKQRTKKHLKNPKPNVSVIISTQFLLMLQSQPIYPFFISRVVDAIPVAFLQTSDIDSVMQHLNVGKSSPPNDISPFSLKHCCHILGPFVSVLFNASIQSGQFLSNWKRGYVPPIFKKGDKQCRKLQAYVIVTFSFQSDGTLHF